jgi:hypothetical protein
MFGEPQRCVLHDLLAPMAPRPLTRRITLPSGRVVEIRQTSGAPVRADRDLCVCPSCRSQLVQPVRWGEEPEGFTVLLRCPECERLEEGVFDDDTLERYDTALDAGTDALVRDHRALSLSNLGEEVERFAAALLAGHVLPEDF